MAFTVKGASVNEVTPKFPKAPSSFAELLGAFLSFIIDTVTRLQPDWRGLPRESSAATPCTNRPFPGMDSVLVVTAGPLSKGIWLNCVLSFGIGSTDLDTTKDGQSHRRRRPRRR